jgi:hypothetical protein
MSTFSGFIEEIDGVSVDCFLDENTRRSTAFFLSHCHAGLTHINYFCMPSKMKLSLF